MSKPLRKNLAICAALALLLALFTVGAFAAADPVQAVNNLSEFIFKVIKAIGLVILAFGIVQLGLSMKSHDPSQRATGFLTVGGGIVIAFAKEIIDLIIA